MTAATNLRGDFLSGHRQLPRRHGRPARSTGHRRRNDRVTTIDHGRGTEVTAREAEVLSLLGRHLTNVQIAETLCISVRTVESHVSALLRKFQLRDRRSLARQAAGSTCCAATECGR